MISLFSCLYLAHNPNPWSIVHLSYHNLDNPSCPEAGLLGYSRFYQSAKKCHHHRLAGRQNWQQAIESLNWHDREYTVPSGFLLEQFEKVEISSDSQALPSYFTVHSHLDHHIPLHHSCLSCPSCTCYELRGLRTPSEKQTLARNASFSCFGTLGHTCTGSAHPFFSIFPSEYSGFFFYFPQYLSKILISRFT